MSVGFVAIGIVYIIVMFCVLYFGNAGDSDFSDFIYATGKGIVHTFGMFLLKFISKYMYLSDKSIFWTIVILSVIFMVIDIIYTNSSWDPSSWFSFLMLFVNVVICSLGFLIASSVNIDYELGKIEPIITKEDFDISECQIDFDEDILVIKYVGFDKDGKAVFDDITYENHIELYKSDSCHLEKTTEVKELYINSFLNSKEENVYYKLFLTDEKISPELLNKINEFLENNNKYIN